MCHAGRSNGIKDGQRVCESDGFVIFNGINNIVFVPFLEASYVPFTRDVSHTKECFRNKRVTSQVQSLSCRATKALC